MSTQSERSTPMGSLIKTTLVDYPGRVACSFFVKGCNLRCPYCYNRELVLGQTTDTATILVSFETVIAHLRHRKNVLTGFVVSGGEPLLNPLVPELIRTARSLGYKIKLDTNGTLPDKLQAFLADETLRPDFIAMDIKTTPSRYESTLAPHIAIQKGSTDSEEKKLLEENRPVQTDSFSDRLQRSVKLISTYPADQREFRTVLVPGLVTEADILAIGAILPKDASWQFAQFRNENCLDASYNTVTPYFDAQINQLISTAQRIIPGAAFR